MRRSQRRRVMARCDALAAISESEEGLTRVYLSPEQVRANARVAEWMQAGYTGRMRSAISAVAMKRRSRRTALLGHLDTVRNAGRYDGMLGVLSAIETVQWLHDHQQPAAGD